MKKNNFGFTLVELLVAMTIVVVLAAVGATIYSSTQKSARISKRIQDLDVVKNALLTYYAANGKYPDNGGTTYNSQCAGSAWSWNGNKANKDVIPGLVPAYMQELPNDPSFDSANSNNCYAYRSDGYNYKFIVHTVAGSGDMVTADYKSQTQLIDPRRDGTPDCTVDTSAASIWSWAIYTTGGCNW